MDSPSPGLTAGMGETLGDGELGEQRVAGCRHGWLFLEWPPADAEVPAHSPSSLAPGDAGTGSCWDTAHHVHMAPVLAW